MMSDAQGYRAATRSIAPSEACLNELERRNCEIRRIRRWKAGMAEFPTRDLGDPACQPL